MLAADRALIAAPLSVARQTVREALRFGIQCVYVRSQAELPEAGPILAITNYEMLDHFDPSSFGAVVLDESSILKNFEGKVRGRLIEMFRSVPMRLCCSATPAPNDIAEIANHAEFLGLMTRTEMLAAFFVHDDNGWRLKGHAREPFYRWLASWGMSLRKPSDLGYPDAGYELPQLSIKAHYVRTDYRPPDQLFALGLHGIGERAQVRRATVADRVDAAIDLLSGDEPAIAWCGLNDEGRMIAARIPDSVLVEGADTPESKAAALDGFCEGRHRFWSLSRPSLASA